MTTTTPATPTKLRNGSWGAKTQSAVHAGDTVTITTRSGKSWDATVERVVWTNGSVSICATASVPRKPAPRRSHNGECHCGACDDLMSMGGRPGQRVRCPECGGWAEVC